MFIICLSTSLFINQSIISLSSRDVVGSCGGLFYDDMLECITMATWDSIMIRSLTV